MNRVIPKGLRNVSIMTEEDPRQLGHSWRRDDETGDDGLRQRDSVMEMFMPDFRDNDVNDFWFQVFSYLPLQPIDVCLRYKVTPDRALAGRHVGLPLGSATLTDLKLESNVMLCLRYKVRVQQASREGRVHTPPGYMKPLTMVNFLTTALVEAQQHDQVAYLGPLIFLITTRIIDTVNADPFGFYVNLDRLPPHFFYQFSDKAAETSCSSRLIRRLVSYATLEGHWIRWSHDGRYLEASSVDDIARVLQQWPADDLKSARYTSRNKDFPSDNTLMMKAIRKSGFNVIRYSDGSVRLRSPLGMKTRPDLILYFDPRDDPKKKHRFHGIKAQLPLPRFVVVRTNVHYNTRGKIFRHQRGVRVLAEPDWTTLPTLPQIEHERLVKLFYYWDMHDPNICDFRVSGEPNLDPNHRLFTHDQGFTKLDEQYWLCLRHRNQRQLVVAERKKVVIKKVE